MVLVCPDTQLLERLLLGQVPDEDRDELAAHVARCSECTRRLGHLEVVDPLQMALRSESFDATPSGPGSVFEPWILQGAVENASDTASESLFAGATASPSTMPDGSQAGPFSAHARASALRKRLGNYQLLQVLGRGGMGVVFVAEDLQLRRPAAVKVMAPALAMERTCRERFMREARSAARVESDYIVPIYHVDEDDGVPYLAMPLLKGETLDARLRRERLLPVFDVLRIGREIALGLAAAHDHGLIHRDIKPANIFLEGPTAADPSEGRFPRVKILDFGLARAVDGDTQISHVGPILGTPAYMAPEQAEGRPVDARADLFSLGCVLYHLATGSPPFKRPTLTATVIALAMHRPRPPIEVNPSLPSGLSGLIMELLARRPAERPASAREVAARLADLEGPGAARAVRDPRRWRRRAIIATMVSVVGASLALLGGMLHVGNEDRTPAVAGKVRTPDPFQQAYDSVPGAETQLGSATSAVQNGAAGARYRQYERGQIILPPGSPTAFAIYGPIFDAYLSIAEQAVKLGHPLGGVDDGFQGALYVRFERGEIILPPQSRRAHVLYGPFYQAYAGVENAGATFGSPRGAIQLGYSGAWYVPFERGEIILPPGSPTAHALYGSLFEAYQSLRIPAGTLGHPTSGVYTNMGTRRIDFERGWIESRGEGTARVHLN